MWKITLFGVKSGQDLKNRAPHPTKNILEYPPGQKLVSHDEISKATDTGLHPGFRYDRIGISRGQKRRPENKAVYSRWDSKQSKGVFTQTSIVVYLNYWTECYSPGQQHELDWYISNEFFVVVLLSLAIIYVPSLHLIRMPGSDRGWGSRTPLCQCEPLTDIKSPFCSCTRDSLRCFRGRKFKGDPQY